LSFVQLGSPAAYDAGMTAAFDATRGTDQRFTDALSGSDGTADPSVMMPVLDVYPDALSAPMPIDLVPIVRPAIPLSARAVTNADTAGGRAPAQRSRAQGRPQAAAAQAGRPAAAARGPQRPAVKPPAAPPQSARPYAQPAQRSVTVRTTPARPAPRAPTALPPARPTPTGPTINWQGQQVSAADVAAMFRGSFAQSGHVDRTSFQATHPQSTGSISPEAVAPAAPMASQYTARGRVRNDARDRTAERRRVSSTAGKRKSSVGAVLVFFFVILFASGLGEKLIDLINELFNR
jgi:hypothetical protein